MDCMLHVPLFSATINHGHGLLLHETQLAAVNFIQFIELHFILLYCIICGAEKIIFTICNFWNLEKCIWRYMLTGLLQSIWTKDLSFYFIHQSDVFYCVILCSEIIDTWLCLPRSLLALLNWQLPLAFPFSCCGTVIGSVIGSALGERIILFVLL